MSDSRIGRVGQIKIYIGKCFRTFSNEKGWKSLISTLIISIILAWVIGDDTFSVNESTKTGVFVQQFHVYKYDDYMIFVAVTAQNSFDANSTVNNIRAVE